MVNKNIGKLEGVIKSAIRVSNSIDRGPMQLSDTNMINRIVPSTNIESDPNVFIRSIHKWGSNQYKVSK